MLGKHPKDNPCTKHIDVKYRYVCEVVKKIIDVVHVPTGDMFADESVAKLSFALRSTFL